MPRAANQRRDNNLSRASTGTAGISQKLDNALREPSRKSNIVICLLLALATLALYSPAIGHPFIFNYDDDVYVINNPHVQSGLSWNAVAWAVTSTQYSNWHPLTWLSHALDYEVYGLNPYGHHLTNVLLHTLSVVLLFLLLTRATGAVGRSLLVAALFAIHPMNVESVAWVAERKNVLSTLFFLLTLGAYGWYAAKPNVKRYLVLAFLFVLALAAKPMVVTLPFVLLLLDFWPLQRIQGWGQMSTAFPVPQVSFSRLVLEKLPLLALSAADCAITIFAQRSGGSMRLVLPLSVRLENAIYAYAMYVWKGFWPARLAVFYPHPGATLAVWQVTVAGLFLLLVTALVWCQRAARPYLITGWLWFLGTLVPVIGLVQVGEQAIADRYAYIPLIGIFVMLVWGVADLAEVRHVNFGTRAKAAAVVLGILVLCTCDQMRYWRSAVDLWAHTVDVTKDNFFGEQNLGAALLASERYPEAEPHFQKAIKLRPSDPGGYLNLAAVFALTNRPRDAVQEYETVVPMLSNGNMRLDTYETLGRLYSELGQYSKARASFQEVLRMDPQHADAKEGLEKVELSDAIRNVAESPSGEGYFRLGQIFQRAGRAPEAQSAYRQALVLNPKLGEAQKALETLNAQ